MARVRSQVCYEGVKKRKRKKRVDEKENEDLNCKYRDSVMQLDSHLEERDESIIAMVRSEAIFDNVQSKKFRICREEKNKEEKNDKEN